MPFLTRNQVRQIRALDAAPGGNGSPFCRLERFEKSRSVFIHGDQHHTSVKNSHLYDTLIWCYDAAPNNTPEVMISVNMLDITVYITGENHAQYTCNKKRKPAEDSG